MAWPEDVVAKILSEINMDPELIIRDLSDGKDVECNRLVFTFVPREHVYELDEDQ